MQSGIAPWPGNTTRGAPATIRASLVTATSSCGATHLIASATERTLLMP